MPRGFDLSKGPNQKTFGTKGTISAKQNPRGFDLSKGPNQKTFGTKSTISAKQKSRGFDLIKRSEPKNLRHKRTTSAKQMPKGFERIERRMPEMGETFFYPNPRHPSFDNPPRQQRARKGGRHFSKKQNLWHCLDNEKITFRRPPPSNNPLERGGDIFL